MSSRRRFLRTLSLSALTLPVASWATGSSPLKNLANEPYDGPVLRVAIMGLGNYATRVAKAMENCTKAKLIGLISGTPSKMEEWRHKYNIPEKNCYNYENFESIRNNPDIDVVYVITPNGLHHKHVLQAAKAGKHVICEKPLGINAAQAQEMVDVCHKAGVKLLTGYRLHFEPNTLEIIRLRNAGEFGKIMFFDALCGFTIGDPTQWRLKKEISGGGSLMDIGIYAINGARYMIGEEPLWVTAQETKTDPEKFKKGIDETLLFQFGFPGGAIASCLSSYNMNYLDRFFLNGTKGFAELHPATGYGPIKGRTDKGPLNQPEVVQQTEQMDGMADIILNNKKPVIAVDGEEAVKDLKIIDAIYKAVDSGKKVELHLE